MTTKLIVIEGPDKLGKQTQSKLLETALRNMDYDGLAVEVPYNDGPVYKRIYEMLETGDAQKYPEIFQAFQCANRMNWQREEYKELACATDFIILDRWSVSGWVYGRAAGLSDDSLRVMHQGLKKPDLVFIFQGDAFKTEDREDDCYEADKSFQKSVRFQYQNWLRQNKDIGVEIDANRNKEVILEELIEHCRRTL